MKKIVFLYIIIAVALFFASCSDDDSTTSSTAKYVTINLQIGTDSTLNISGSSTPFTYNNSAQKLVMGKTLTATRAVIDGVTVPDFVPEVPNTFTAYILASKDLYDSNWNRLVAIDDVINSITVHTGSNFVTIPNTYNGKTISFSASDLKIYVTNYSHGAEMGNHSWYTWADSLNHIPQRSTKLYLYGHSNSLQEKTDTKYGNILIGEVKMNNYYAAACVYKNKYIQTTPICYWSDDLDNTPNTFAQSGDWYYIYINCAQHSTTNMGIEITPHNGYTPFNDNISANNIYQYVFTGD